MNAYFATVAFENMSLTLPPATDRNADPQNPVMNRKIRYTSIHFRILALVVTRGVLTDIWGERDRPREDEEESIRDPVYDVPSIHLTQGPDQQRTQTETQNEETYAEDGDFFGQMELCGNTCFRECSLTLDQMGPTGHICHETHDRGGAGDTQGG